MMASPGSAMPGAFGDLADRGDAERARHDGDVRVGGAFLQHQAAQPLAVVVEQRRRAHRAGDQDGVVGQLLARRRVILADQLPHQAVAEIVEVVQPLAQIRIGRAQHAGAGVGLHALDRGLGGEAGARPPRAAGATSRGRWRTCGRLRARRDARRRRRRRRAPACGRDRRAASPSAVVQPLEFLRHVVGDEVGDDDARLVQHHMAERDAVGQRPRRSGAASAAPRARRRAAPAPTARPRRSSPPAPWRWSAAPRPLPRHRCAGRGSAPPARRACCRRAGSARRGTSGRFLRRFPAGRRRPDGSARRTG